MNLENSTPLRYRADVDGLRAIAVLSVLFFHADIGFPGGFVGVDVFFVISGYLITGLILKDLTVGQFRILDFWERRVRRILPALTVVVLASLIAGWFLFLPSDFKALGRSTVAQAILASNVNFWRESGYFSQAAELKPLLHTWSLAVEEQFYLVFPFLLVIIHRISRAWIFRVILLICCVSFALSVYFSYSHPSANFYLLPTRAWELLIGSFLAAIPGQRGTVRWVTESLSWTGLLAIICAVVFYDRDTRFPGIAAVLPCAGAALLIWANGYTLTSVGKLLASRPIVFVGLISYSLYLWHWPVLVFSRYLTIDSFPMSQRMLLLAASVVLAILSWRFVETPFRNRLILNRRSQIFSFAIIATTILSLGGLAIYKSQGVPSRLPPEVLRYSNGSTNDYHAVQEMSYRVGLKEALAGDFIELGIGDKRMPINFLLWGDSHSAAVIPIIDTLCREHSIRGIAAMYAGTAPLVGYESPWSVSLKEKSLAYNNAIVEFIRTNHIVNVIFVAKWGAYVGSSGADRIQRAFRETMSALHEPTRRFYIMRHVPKPRWDVPRALALACLHGVDPDDLGVPLDEYLRDSQRLDSCYEALSAEFSNVAVLDPIELFLGRNEMCRIEKNDKALFCDDSHLSAAGAAELRPLFEPIFQLIGKSKEPAGQ